MNLSLHWSYRPGDRSIDPSVLTAIFYSSIYAIYPYTSVSIYLSIHLPTHSLIYLLIRLSTYLFIYLLIYSSIYICIYSSIYLFFHLSFSYLLIHSSITHQSIYSSISSSTHLSMNSYDEMSFIFDPSANPNRPVRFDRMILR